MDIGPRLQRRARPRIERGSLLSSEEHLKSGEKIVVGLDIVKTYHGLYRILWGEGLESSFFLRVEEVCGETFLFELEDDGERNPAFNWAMKEGRGLKFPSTNGLEGGPVEDIVA